MSDRKLTKKQQKAVAFRDRKTGKAKGKQTEAEDNDLPVMENQDDIEIEQAKPVPAPKKRKIDSVDDASAPVESASHKKRKKTASETTTSKERFILFLGNLKYSTPKEAIAAHFAGCDPPPTIRLLTPKPRPGAPPSSAKSKGCAFLEFSHRNALQQGLKLHGSTLDSRQINVELTAGGGGKSDARIDRVKNKNKGLVEQRKEKQEKQAKVAGLPIPFEDRPQRYSSTSGTEMPVLNAKTWTVGDHDDGETHRGGKKHSKMAKPRRSMGTGANMIAIRTS